MKLNSVSSVKIQNSQSSNKNNNTSFRGGISDSLVAFWQFVDNGGRAMQFTIEDMTGTNIPRSIKGAAAGYKYTHKFNLPGFLQEFIREILTGPVMCLSPFVILKAAKSMMGKTSNTHIENISNLSYLMNGMQSTNGVTFEDNFYKKVFSDAILKTTGEPACENDVNDLIEGVKKYASARYDKKLKTKHQDKILADIQKTFESIVKKQKNNYENASFLKTNYSLSEHKTGSTGFKNYVEYTVDYAKDFVKKFTNHEGVVEIYDENIKSFKNNWMGKRAIVVASMFFITGLLMSYIPKLYTWASGSINPNASAIYNEAEILKNKEDK